MTSGARRSIRCLRPGQERATVRIECGWGAMSNKQSRWSRFKSWLREKPGAVDLTAQLPVVDRALALADELADLSDDQLRTRIGDAPQGLLDSDPLLADFLAVMSELADRKVAMRPFPVQLQAAAGMLRGTSVELATGEGKTLVGALVAAGFVQSGLSVHVLSANDYLAERDAAWMGPLFDAAGIRVAAVTSATPRATRPDAYAAPVVYIPVTEAGFDVLRDRLCLDASDRVGIEADVAVLDEADAVLLDEARVPLVLAGEAAATEAASGDIAALVATLVEGTHFDVDADRRTLHLTEEGLGKIEEAFPDVDLFDADQVIQTRVHVALHAEVLLTRDVDYVVEHGRVRLVSQSRGRVDELQRWPEGLQEAVEAKEHLAPSSGVEVLDQLLVRDLVDRYDRSVGMSATLVSAAEELHELYEMRTAALPENRPRVRIDEPDRLYATIDDRDAAALELIAETHGRGQPVLVATVSVAESERFAQLLAERSLDAAVLNAKNDKQEADVIARAGEQGRITVSTQMAGRGTDIRLGEGSAELGGLSIVGLSRFPSQRLDDQLRGRAGRQGDPGQTVFLVSLEDELIAEYAPEQTVADETDDDGLVRDRRLREAADHAQRVADGQQRELRDLSRRYGSLPAAQRQDVLARREELLTTDLAWREIGERLPDRAEGLAAQLADEQLIADARIVALTCLDAAWADHLAYAMELREGIHLRALGRQEPLAEFNRLIQDAFSGLFETARAQTDAIMESAPVHGDALDLDAAGVKRPGATWTYMVTDDHFGSEWERIGTFFARGLGLKP